MAGLADVRNAALEVVGPICGFKARSFSEGDVGRILHAYLVGRHAGVWPECPSKLEHQNGPLIFVSAIDRMARIHVS